MTDATFEPDAVERFEACGVRMEIVPCPSCGCPDGKPIVETRDYEMEIDLRFTIKQCPRCELAYTSPRPVFSDLLRVFYGDDYLCYQGNTLMNRVRKSLLGKAHIELFRPWVSAGGSVLDVGCATGEMLDYLQENTDWSIHGCEPKESVAEQAAQRGLQVVGATLRQAGYDEGSFDVVNMNHVIEHLPDVDETTAEVFRVLKPGGVFVTENPDFGGITRPLFGAAWWGFHLPRHLTHFTPETMRSFLEKHGFEIVEIESCFRPTLISWSIQNAIRLRGWPEWLVKIFGMNNPAFVALMFPFEWWNKRRGRTDVIKTIARKPA